MIEISISSHLSNFLPAKNGHFHLLKSLRLRVFIPQVHMKVRDQSEKGSSQIDKRVLRSVQFENQKYYASKLNHKKANFDKSAEILQDNFELWLFRE